MIMLVAGMINSIFSILTLKNEELRKVGCGMYFMASSITSLLTVCIFTFRFWFLLITEMNASSISLSTLRVGCMCVETTLKLFLYLNGWLNACIAVERSVHVFKGVTFNKKKSKCMVRWIILILILWIIGTIIHEPLHRNIFEYKKRDGLHNDNRERQVWCLTSYSSALQNYNTAILFFHLLGPFIANLLSTVFIIFGTARQRSLAQTQKTYPEHLLGYLRDHKQLVIIPIILLILASPRLIISLLSGCLNASQNPWLYQSAYFISFTPSILVFVVFVLPSKLFRKKFKESLKHCQCRRQ